MYGNYQWGSRDPYTGLWNGVVGMVGYGHSDVGVSIISYTEERNSFIDYSPPVGTDSMVWVTKGGLGKINCLNICNRYHTDIINSFFFPSQSLTAS